MHSTRKIKYRKNVANTSTDLQKLAAPPHNNPKQVYRLTNPQQIVSVEFEPVAADLTGPVASASLRIKSGRRPSRCTYLHAATTIVVDRNRSTETRLGRCQR